MEQGDVTRKLAAIFYADVAGYSRLMGADEDGTHQTLSAYLDDMAAAIKGHGGRVVNFADDANPSAATARTRQGPPSRPLRPARQRPIGPRCRGHIVRRFRE